jgi:hypothetical protein
VRANAGDDVDETGRFDVDFFHDGPKAARR